MRTLPPTRPRLPVAAALGALALLAAAPVPPAIGMAAAQEQEAPAEEDTAAVRDTADGVRFDFQDADLRSVLTALAEASGMNVVYSDLPDRSVTLRTATPVAPEQIPDLLESVVDAQGLEMEESAGVVRIYAPDEEDDGADGDGEGREGPDAGDAAPSPDAPPRLFVHRLAHADAPTVAQLLRTLFGLGGGAEGAGAPGAGAGTGRTSLSERLRNQEATGYRSLADPEDGQRPPRPQARPPARGQAPVARDGADREEDEEGDGTSVLLQGPVQIVPDTRTNSILVLANPADFGTVEGAIEQLDRRPLQVLIEALIVEVRSDDLNRIGTEVDVPVGDDDGDDDGAAPGDADLDVGGGISAEGDAALEVLGIGSVDASAVLTLLSQSTDATILSRPVVMAQNNEEARILVGDQRPFVQLSRATEGGAVDQVVQYQNVGTELRIRPTINRDGFVNLEVLQEVSNATQVTQFNAPVINTRESETDVLVRDGRTVVLGGLVDRETESTRSGIPLLKDIPVLGGLFGNTSEREVASELFILLTPHVLHTDEDMVEVREQVRDASQRLDEAMPDPLPLFDTGAAGNDSLPAPDTVPEPADGETGPTGADGEQDGKR